MSILESPGNVIILKPLHQLFIPRPPLASKDDPDGVHSWGCLLKLISSIEKWKEALGKYNLFLNNIHTVRT